MKKAFTLIEMIVVIGIIGILMAVLIGSFTGSTESARSAKCLANLHNLGSAWGSNQCSAGSTMGMPPFQGLHQVGTKEGEQLIYEVDGWISWFSDGKLPKLDKFNNPTFNVYASENRQSSDWFISTYLDGRTKQGEYARTYCLTNGALWQALACNRNAYVCPKHLIMAQDGKCNVPCWSYVMNGTYDITIGAKLEDGELPSSGGVNHQYKVGTRTLLFCELPFVAIKGFQTPDYTEASGTANDAILEVPVFSTSSGNSTVSGMNNALSASGGGEAIGFNHKSANRYVAHVCFADAHTEKLTMPEKMTRQQAQDLTKLIANGRDFSFNGKKYEEVK